jgi:hypothetical protein
MWNIKEAVMSQTEMPEGFFYYMCSKQQCLNIRNEKLFQSQTQILT